MERFVVGVTYVFSLTMSAVMTVVLFVSSVQDSGFGNHRDSNIEFYFGIFFLAMFIVVALFAFRSILEIALLASRRKSMDELYEYYEELEDDDTLYLDLGSGSSSTTSILSASFSLSIPAPQG